jgi:hypothetical protein
MKGLCVRGPAIGNNEGSDEKDGRICAEQARVGYGFSVDGPIPPFCPRRPQASVGVLTSSVNVQQRFRQVFRYRHHGAFHLLLNSLYSAFL